MALVAGVSVILIARQWLLACGNGIYQPYMHSQLPGLLPVAIWRQRLGQ